jgi:uncharacterized YigZ family protein
MSCPSYRSVACETTAEVVERKSRFIACAAPAQSEQEALAVLARIRAENPEARHNVWAYLLRDGRERCSDDGEPQKTAGLPTLEVLRRSGLADVVVVTTRYFGGVLLGTGGLVRAYTAAAQEVLAAAPAVEYTSCVDVRVRVSYALYEIARRLVEDCGGKVGEASFAADVAFDALFRAGEQAAFEKSLSELARGERLCEVGEPRFCAF